MMFGQLSFFLGIALAIGSIVLVNWHASLIKKNEPGVTVLRCKGFVPTGAETDGATESVVIPKRLAEALANPVLDKDKALIKEKRVVSNVRGGEFLLWTHFGEGAQGGGRKVITELAKDKRAMAVPVKFTSAVAGWVRPGDYVDIMSSTEVVKDNQSPEIFTLTLLQDMRVLGVGWGDRQQEQLIRGRGVDRQAKSVILEVTPREAELLNFAITQKSELVLTLRTPNDRTKVPLPRMNIDVFLHHLEKMRGGTVSH